MRDDSTTGPSRRTVIAGVAAAGVGWTVPVVLSGSPAAAQASGCALVSGAGTPVCTGDPSIPFGIDFSVTVAGCVGTYSIQVLQGGTPVGCFHLPAGGGFLVGAGAPWPVINESFTYKLFAGSSCAGPELGSTSFVASTPGECPPPGAPADGSVAPTIRLLV